MTQQVLQELASFLTTFPLPIFSQTASKQVYPLPSETYTLVESQM